MVGGHRVEGRFVADEAYAAYLRGVVLETQGHLDAAAAAYGEAIRHDPDSAELWTRIGVLRCAAKTQPGDPATSAGPWDAFTHASEIDPDYEETWTERARCHLKRGQLDNAARAARVAVSLDPERSEAAVLLALILERQGNVVEARRWLDGLIVREPTSIEAHDAMLAFAARTHDEARGEAAERALAELRPARSAEQPLRLARPSLSEVDAALVQGDFDRARKLALASRLSSGTLALRAVALGSADFAHEQAELVLAADPSDNDARIAAAVAADLTRDEPAFARALSSVPAFTMPLSPLATLLMGELLGRRVGPAARSAWLAAAGPIGKKDDALLETVAARK
jgi:tetratricopeptide (TPR) repeat protein